MAARRLMVVMLLLLGMSILVAVTMQPEMLDEPDEDDVATTEPAEAPGPRGKLVSARIDAKARRPEVIELRIGDQLALTVRSQQPDQVEIPALGELRFVGPQAPARFDILAWEEATYGIRLIDADRVVGRIVVEAARAPRGGGGRMAGRAKGTRKGEARE